MKPVEFLIRQVRRRTNTLDPQAISNFEILEYFNDAQRLIQQLVIQSDNTNGFFESVKDYPIVKGQREYDLPKDCWATSSISGVYFSNFRDKAHSRLKKVDFKERASAGYTIRGNKLILTSGFAENALSNLKVVYNRRLPKLSVKVGKVTGEDNGKLEIDVLEKDFWKEDDTVTLTLLDGTTEEFPLVDFDDTQNLLDCGFSAGNVPVDLNSSPILLGSNVTNTSELPIEVRPFLLNYVGLYIRRRRKSTKVQEAFTFSGEERSIIIEIFQKINTDIQYPLISDVDFLGM